MTDLYKYYVVGDTVNGYELKNDGKDCISIKSKEEMEYLSKYTNANYVTENVTFVLINDIDLNPGVTIGTDGTITGGTPEKWISIGTGNPFKGILDGCNYSIVGLYSNDTSKANSGLFGVIDGATIQNLIVSNSYLAGKESGIVVDKSIGNGVLLKNIISKENYIFCKGGKVGGIIGYDKSNKMNINNCYNLGKIYSAKIESGEFGGIIGQENTDDFLMYNCYNFGEIYASEEKYVFGDIGGLIGGATIDNGEIYNCYNKGKINLYLVGVTNINSRF